MTEKKEPPACLICGGRESLLQEAGVCLCERCVEALGEALFGLPEESAET